MRGPDLPLFLTRLERAGSLLTRIAFDVYPRREPYAPRKREALAVPTEAEKMPSVRVIPTVNDGDRGVSSQHKSCARPLSVIGLLNQLAPLSVRGRLGNPGMPF